jgi:hypothetical protein
MKVLPGLLASGGCGEHELKAMGETCTGQQPQATQTQHKHRLEMPPVPVREREKTQLAKRQRTGRRNGFQFEKNKKNWTSRVTVLIDLPSSSSGLPCIWSEGAKNVVNAQVPKWKSSRVEKSLWKPTIA